MDRSEPQASDSEITTPGGEGVSGHALASYNTRFGAFIIDLVFYALFYGLLGLCLNRVGVDRAEEWAAFVVGPLLYWVGFVALGVTPAAWLCDVRIVDHRGRAPGMLRAIRRSLVPGTVWVFVVHGSALFDPRIDVFFEVNPGFGNLLFICSWLALMCFLWSYLRKADKGELSTVWHDGIAGTRVIEYRSERREAIGREIKAFRISLSRMFALPSREDRSSLGDVQANRADEEV